MKGQTGNNYIHLMSEVQMKKEWLFSISWCCLPPFHWCHCCLCSHKESVFCHFCSNESDWLLLFCQCPPGYFICHFCWIVVWWLWGLTALHGIRIPLSHARTVINTCHLGVLFINHLPIHTVIFMTNSSWHADLLRIGLVQDQFFLPSIDNCKMIACA